MNVAVVLAQHGAFKKVFLLLRVLRMPPFSPLCPLPPGDRPGPCLHHPIVCVHGFCIYAFKVFVYLPPTHPPWDVLDHLSSLSKLRQERWRVCFFQCGNLGSWVAGNAGHSLSSPRATLQLQHFCAKQPTVAALLCDSSIRAAESSRRPSPPRRLRSSKHHVPVWSIPQPLAEASIRFSGVYVCEVTRKLLFMTGMRYTKRNTSAL